jgi:hypothetical protein
MSPKAYVTGALAVSLVGGAWLLSPQLGGLALIVLALAALAAFAYRLL